MKDYCSFHLLFMPSKQGILVGERVISNIPFLKSLSRSKSYKRRWMLLKKASSEELLTLVEICCNILRPGQFCLSQKQIERLQKFAPAVRVLSKKRSENKARTFLLNQHGNGPLFAALLTPIIGEVARLLLNKYVYFKY